jgi:hypothetical protein
MREQDLLIPTDHELTAAILAGTLDSQFFWATSEYFSRYMPRYLHIKPYHKQPYREPVQYRIAVGGNFLVAFTGSNPDIKPIYCKSNNHDNAIYRVSVRHVRERMRVWLLKWHGLYSCRHVGVETTSNNDMTYNIVFRSG